MSELEARGPEDHEKTRHWSGAPPASFRRLLEIGRHGLAGKEGGTGGLVLGLEPRHDLGGGRRIEDLAHALARAPDVAPRLDLGVAARAEVHLALVGHRK